MPGKPITLEQVNLYMSYRKHPQQLQAISAAKAGFSERILQGALAKVSMK